MNRQLSNEMRFAYKVRQALNETVEQLPAERLVQLAAARKNALRLQKPERHALQWNTRALPAGASHASSSLPGTPSPWGRLGLACSMALLVLASVVGLYFTEQDNRINDLAELDTGVLVDDIPISAYADHGFNAYLKRVALRSQNQAPGASGAPGTSSIANP